jgi:hypothetical protein
MIAGCEACSDGAEIPDNILDRLTGSDPSVTDYDSTQPRNYFGQEVCNMQ